MAPRGLAPREGQPEPQRPPSPREPWPAQGDYKHTVHRDFSRRLHEMQYRHQQELDAAREAHADELAAAGAVHAEAQQGATRHIAELEQRALAYDSVLEKSQRHTAGTQAEFEAVSEQLAFSNQENVELHVRLALADADDENAVQAEHQAEQIARLNGWLHEQQATCDAAVARADVLQGLVAMHPSVDEVVQQLAVLRGALKAAERRHQTATIRVIASVTQKMKQRGATKSLNAWRAFAMQTTQLRLVLQKVVKRLQHKAAAYTFERWWEPTVEKSSVRTKACKAIMRLQQRTLACAFVAWQSTAHRAVHARVVGEKAIRRLRNAHRLVSTAFDAWMGWAVCKVSERVRVTYRDRFRSDIERAESTMTRRVLMSSAQKMKMHAVTKSWNAWCSHTIQKVTVRPCDAWQGDSAAAEPDL